MPNFDPMQSDNARPPVATTPATTGTRGHCTCCAAAGDLALIYVSDGVHPAEPGMLCPSCHAQLERMAAEANTGDLRPSRPEP